jgi:hypothetical protein
MFSFIVSDYNVWLVIGNSSVSLHLLIPQYSPLAYLICDYWVWYMFVPVFFCPVAPLFPCICSIVFAHSLYHAVLLIVLLPVLGMLLLYGLLSHDFHIVIPVVCVTSKWGGVVNNTTSKKDVIFKMKLHVSANSGHLQVSHRFRGIL